MFCWQAVLVNTLVHQTSCCIALCCITSMAVAADTTHFLVANSCRSDTGSKVRLDAIECAFSNSPCTACCEPHHEVCINVLTEGVALPCRAHNPATPEWTCDNLTSALIAYPIRSGITLDCLSFTFGYSNLAASRICWQVLSCMI